MPNHPLILFPSPEMASRSKANPFPGKIHTPSFSRQNERLTPKFQELQNAIERKRVTLQRTSSGLDPELALVIETIGSIDKFINAVKKIDGLEWLGEIEEVNIEPDDDFYMEDDKENLLGGKLFLLFVNQSALDQILKLWRDYCNKGDKKNSEIFKRGYAKFGTLFAQIKEIRFWDTRDRLSETGIIEEWKRNIDKGDIFKFEIELWFRKSPEKRNLTVNNIEKYIKELRGRVIYSFVLDSIEYHSVLAELPSIAIQEILHDTSVSLLNYDGIMFFRPVGQMSAIEDYTTLQKDNDSFSQSDLPIGQPIVALLDGLPLSNHLRLKNRIIIDDPFNWSEDYEAESQQHGTTMASLIIHGDLNDNNKPLSRPIYTRPIMKPINWPSIPRLERVPDDILIVDLIHQSVVRLFEGQEGGIAPTIRIINLSIGDPNRQFDLTISPLAKLLDWLSYKYNILFIISAGNHQNDIEIDTPVDVFNSLSNEEKQNHLILSILQKANFRKILSPAESINNLTIGSCHLDFSQPDMIEGIIDFLVYELPSPVSAFGGGFRRSIKPDILFMGGKQVFLSPVHDSQKTLLSYSKTLRPPGNRVAIPGYSQGDVTKSAHTRGTSNATALISREASFCYESLENIFIENNLGKDNSVFYTPLIKAMLVHGCVDDSIALNVERIISSSTSPFPSKMSRRWVGYGKPDIRRVLECNDQRATLLGMGKLRNDEAHIYKLPLPPSLASKREWRRLTITLAWFSPISFDNQKYRVASLWFEVDGVDLASQRENASGGTNGWRSVRRGTIQHEVFTGQNAEPFTDGQDVEIKVNCKDDAGKIIDPIHYGLLVTLEVAEGIDIQIYNEIQNRIRPIIRIQNPVT